MPCFHPKKRFDLKRVNPKTGKSIGVITDYAVQFIVDNNGSLEFHREPLPDGWKDSRGVFSDFVQVPCNRCLGCRVRNSREWSLRAYLESLYHDDNWFVTLTYDDAHLPIACNSALPTGEYLPEQGTLKKKDFQNFLKRLRFNLVNNYGVQDLDLRYLACGEYGQSVGSTYRPHYHAILFGCPLGLDELTLRPLNHDKDNYFNSKIIDDAWQNRGFSVVAPFTIETAAYVARYVTKKLGYENSELYETMNIEPEFCLRSCKPSLGKRWFDDHPDCVLDDDRIYLDGKVYRLPKYFDYLTSADSPEELAELKLDRREVADAVTSAELRRTDKDFVDYLRDKEYTFKRRLSSVNLRDRVKGGDNYA